MTIAPGANAMKNAMIWGWIFLLTAAAVHTRGDEIASWNSAGSVPQALSFAPTAFDANVTVSNLIRGIGLSTSGSPGANTFWAVGYNDSTTNSSALTNGDYWETSIAPVSGISVSYSDLKFRFRATATGPQMAQWAYSLNGSSFTWLGSAFVPPTTYSELDLNLSGVGDLQNCAGKVWFRLAGWTASSATGPGGFGQNTNVLIFSGTIGSSGPVYPTVSFNPSGSQSVPVSNTLTLAVSITPAGSGMQSWSLVPAYAGSASLTNGSFNFTPANSDSNKNFTLSVIATNSVGARTGTVSISVTAYVPPVPVITFSPAAPYSIMATQTQKLGVAVTPAGSGIASWSLLPAYSGSANLVGTNFTFVSAAADASNTYAFSVVATNIYGSTTGVASIAVTGYIPPPPPGSVVVDFEDAPTKTSYAPTTNTLSGRSWLLGGVIGDLANDKKFDLKALRIRANSGDNEIKLCSLTPFAAGIESVSLWFASYGNDGTNNLPQVSVEISTNLNSGWITLDTFDTGSASQLVYRATAVKVSEPVYFRLTAPTAGTDKRADIDNIIIAPYLVPTGYDAFLLQYNVTPGDPGTAEGDDLDGDGATNLQEFNAFPKTNPYDEASHP
jgi:hypothetical protein